MHKLLMDCSEIAFLVLHATMQSVLKVSYMVASLWKALLFSYHCQFDGQMNATILWGSLSQLKRYGNALFRGLVLASY